MKRTEKARANPGTLQICSICTDSYDGWGHNAEPFSGRCCTECNDRFVIPARIIRMKVQRKKTERMRSDLGAAATKL